MSDHDDEDDEAEERLDEARAEEGDNLRKGGTIGVGEVEELSEVAAVYFNDDAFERAFDGVEGQDE